MTIKICTSIIFYKYVQLNTFGNKQSLFENNNTLSEESTEIIVKVKTWSQTLEVTKAELIKVITV